MGAEVIVRGLSIFLSRRRALARLGGLFGLGALGSAVGCREVEPRPLRIPLAELPPGGRLERDLDGVPVEVRRTETGVEARSLLCTHMGCRVVWRQSDSDYFCPCHEGRFDPRGRVLAGPAPRPLTHVPARVEAGRIVVG